MSLFITFEGGEGCGKSTQARALHRRLLKAGVPACLTHEPGVTPLGKKITRLLKWAPEVAVTPLAELLLFNASRAQLVAELIKPELAGGKVVTCDRYADSTTAYQGYGRGLDMNTVAAANAMGTAGLKPNLTVLLDMPVATSLARKAGRKPDRFEAEDKAFHQRVRDGYLKLAQAEPQRWLVIDATLSQKEIGEIIWEKVEGMLGVG